MDVRAIDEMAALEDVHWWFLGKRLLVSTMLPPPAGPALDFGCGTGAILRTLAADRPAVGADQSLEALQHCARRGLPALVRAGATSVPFRTGTFGLITALDVIEHVDDDLGLLRDLRRALRPGGHLLAAVPAYQALWSRHDEALGHRRRYDRGGLERVLRAAGFEVDRITYTNMFALPPAALWRLLGRLRPNAPVTTDFEASSGPLNAFLYGLYRLEARLVARWRLPFGLSVFALARNPAP